MSSTDPITECDVLIVGSGPIGATYARTILEKRPDAKIIMCEIGSQDNPVIGAHHKNSIKYQKDIDSFVHVIQGALQPVSVPPQGSYMSTLGDIAWTPPIGQQLTQAAHNPNQKAEENLPGCAVTRTVGGMATHWTCACPRPHLKETEQSPISRRELDKLLDEAAILLNVNDDQYDDSIRHNLVKKALSDAFGKERVKNLPLAVQRNKENPEYVTWSGTDTVLGVYASKIDLRAETRVTKLVRKPIGNQFEGALCRDLKTRKNFLIRAKKYVIAAGAVCTPQILHNSNIRPPALGRYLAEQSIAFCQIVMKRSLINSIPPRFKDRSDAHSKKNKGDPLPIPFSDPEPQVTMPYDVNYPYHTQIHRDAFSYGDVGPKADPRTVVDLRYFGRQDIDPENRMEFAKTDDETEDRSITDLYGMPQVTFFVKRSVEDAKRDHSMMLDMCTAANALGAFLPGSYPQFMEPGLALHITGTTRLGRDPKESVADSNSKVHGFEDVYVGGNGCIPDSTACNPTLTSCAYAIKGARALAESMQA